MLTLVSLFNFDPIFEQTLIPVPIHYEHKSPIFDSHVQLLETECEFQFFNLDQTLEPNLVVEPKLDLSQFYDSALVSIPFIPKLNQPQHYIKLHCCTKV